jgi:CHAT domain-containing protein/tetratricopeptide (TPR) repeat protein
VRTLGKLAAAALILANATAQTSSSERLLAAADQQAAEQILAGSAGEINQTLFETVRISAQSKLDKRELAQALREFGVALAVAERLNLAADIAAAYLGTGISQLRMGQLSASLASFDKGYPPAAECGDKLLLANLLRSRGISYSSLGRFPEGLADAARSLALYRELDDRRGASFVLNNTCGAQMVLGNLRQAAADCEEAFRLSRGIPDAAGVGIGNLGPIMAQQGNYAAARDYLEESIRLLDAQHDLQHLAGALRNIGPVYRQLGELDKALAAYGRSVVVARQAHDTPGEAMALFNRAALYLKPSDTAKALADLREGLRLQEHNDSSYETVYGLEALSQYESYHGQVEEGCTHAGRALAIAQRFHSPPLLWPALDAQGVCEMRRDDSPKAKVVLEEAIRQIESIRESAGGGEQEGQAFFAGKMEPYYHLISVLLDLKDPGGALTVAERGKARQLLDTALRGKTQPAQSMTALEVGEEKRLSGEVTRLAQRAASAPAASQAEAQNTWEQARREFESFRGHLYAAHPQLAASRGEAAPFAVDEAADLLPDARTLLVEFVTTSKQVWIFTMERGAGARPRLKVHSVAWDRDALVAAVGAFREQLGTRDLGYRRAAQSIYARLLGPIEPELRAKDTLVLVPDGALWNLPFQALMQGDDVHLLERHTIFYAPSLTYLRESRRHREPPAPHRLLALGNPGAAQLPNAGREVRSLVELYGAKGAKTLTGGEATRQAWLSAAPDYRVLHIATHGILNPANPMYSWLSVAPGKDSADGALEARDILAGNLHADVAVLSACDTARGGVLSGEGLVGMSWAFLAAGARSTVVSQWGVDSAGTSDLMLAFHRNLKVVLDGDSQVGRAQSLQKAMLAIRRMPRYSHPFYWASFVMIGNGY